MNALFHHIQSNLCGLLSTTDVAYLLPSSYYSYPSPKRKALIQFGYIIYSSSSSLHDDDNISSASALAPTFKALSKAASNLVHNAFIVVLDCLISGPEIIGYGDGNGDGQAKETATTATTTTAVKKALLSSALLHQTYFHQP